jgi:hypothetical protein
LYAKEYIVKYSTKRARRYPTFTASSAVAGVASGLRILRGLGYVDRFWQEILGFAADRSGTDACRRRPRRRPGEAMETELRDAWPAQCSDSVAIGEQ